MDLVEIGPPTQDVEIALAYATPENVTGAPIYAHARCYLHHEAAAALDRAIALARPLGLRFRVFDAFRPSEAQWVLWNKFPNPEFLADPRRGSPHSRGVAVDLTLIDDAAARNWRWAPASTISVRSRTTPVSPSRRRRNATARCCSGS